MAINTGNAFSIQLAIFAIGCFEVILQITIFLTFFQEWDMSCFACI
jgi:hypothetical protein